MEKTLERYGKTKHFYKREIKLKAICVFNKAFWVIRKPLGRHAGFQRAWVQISPEVSVLSFLVMHSSLHAGVYWHLLSRRKSDAMLKGDWVIDRVSQLGEITISVWT